MYVFYLLPLHVATEKCYTIITKPIVHIRVATNVVMGALYPKHTRYLSETTQIQVMLQFSFHWEREQKK